MSRETLEDNKRGMWMCNVLIKKPLTQMERKFISSLMRQLLAGPEFFEPSEKQVAWLGDIWRRKGGGNGSN
jgi:hypothetical protein